MFPPKCMYPLEFTAFYLMYANGSITSTNGSFVVIGLVKRVEKKAPEFNRGL